MKCKRCGYAIESYEAAVEDGWILVKPNASGYLFLCDKSGRRKSHIPDMWGAFIEKKLKTI